MISEATEQRAPRKYQSHTRGGCGPSPRVTVVLSAEDAEEIRRRAEARGISESAAVALIVRERLAGDKEGEATRAA